MAGFVDTLEGVSSAEIAAAESEFGNMVEKVTRTDEGMLEKNMSGQPHEMQQPEETLDVTVEEVKRAEK